MKTQIGKYWMDTENGNDANSGSKEYPFKNIERAVDGLDGDSNE